MGKPLPQQAVEECRRELLSACRMPVKPAALSYLVKLLDNRFKQLLGDENGPRQWAAAGPLMRDNSRFLGSFAEFFANRQGRALVDREDLILALHLVKVQCKALAAAGRFPEGLEYCTEVPNLTGEQKKILEAMVAA